MLLVPLAVVAIALQSAAVPAPIAIARANDNRTPAGRLENGVLKIHLVLGMARWYPEAPAGPFVDVPAFSEEGRTPTIPAPLIRVPTGTTIEATVRNTLADSTIYLRGFATRPTKTLDSIPVRPGETKTIRFAAGAPGTYFYLATPGIWDYDKHGEREETGGALVVDPPGRVAPDRIFVLNIWGEPKDSLIYPNALGINGKSWPYTERISTVVGDTLRWRVINATTRNHPMHLHGFYFRVDARGDGMSDSVYVAGARRLGVTEDMNPMHSMYMVWSPDRPGNWLFHCHIAFHVVPGEAQLSGALSDTHAAHSGDIRQHMAGLVLGIDVRPSPNWVAPARENVRKLRLFVDEGRRRHLAPRSMGYVLQAGDTPPAADSVLIPGSVIVLTRNEPTDITVINRLRESTAIHWHGIELESYSDGVVGWSGATAHLAPMIAPGDSFVARLTMPRAGTFIYHTHLNDLEQLTSGLYGAIVVLERGQRFDPATDHIFVAGWDGNPPIAEPTILINGDTTAAPLELAAGVRHRFRFVNIGPATRLVFAIRQDSTLMKWHRLAKDGADLPPLLAITSSASRRLGVGEMFDAEFLPPGPGEYRLTIGVPTAQMKYSRRLIVR